MRHRYEIRENSPWGWTTIGSTDDLDIAERMVAGNGRRVILDRATSEMIFGDLVAFIADAVAEPVA